MKYDDRYDWKTFACQQGGKYLNNLKKFIYKKEIWYTHLQFVVCLYLAT